MLRYLLVLTIFLVGCAGKHTDHQEFQRLLTAQGGWHDISWSKEQDAVEVKHKVGDHDFSFHIARLPGSIEETVYGYIPDVVVWQRKHTKNEQKKGFGPTIHEDMAGLLSQQNIEDLADQLWDAFCQGDTTP